MNLKKNILDIGCGDGFKTYWLSRKNGAIGIDISVDNIELSRKRFPCVDFRAMNIEDLQFDSNYFDRVYALDVLEHIDNLEKAIKEIKRVLKAGGEFIIKIPYWKSEQWLLRIRPSYFQEIHHVRIFQEHELENLLSEIGFTLIKKQRGGFLEHIFLYYMFKRVTKSNTQLGIGHWKDNWKTKVVFIFTLMFDKELLKTPLKYFPLWIITIPIGFIINSVGNIFFPKFLFYNFKNK